MNQSNINADQLFLKSSLCTEGEYTTVENVLDWLKEKNSLVNVKVTRCPINSIEGWELNEKESRIKHKSNKFFSIDGIQVYTNFGGGRNWQQPIINQPEIGFLGIITKMINGTLHFLLQAKIEPGNINQVQLSPTLQATRSNYTKVHGGDTPLYLDYFINAQPSQILVDQLQSEQGGRFLQKRNRNIIICLEEDIEVYEQFVWLTLRQIKDLMCYDNVVNMDTRSVIASAAVGCQDSSLDIISYLLYEQNINLSKKDCKHKSGLLYSSLSKNSLHTIEEIICFLTSLKSSYDLEIKNIRLDKLSSWVMDEMKIYHQEGKYFKVIAVDVEIGDREVVKWSQPMVKPVQQGLCAFLAKEINGILHIAIQAKIESGNRDIVEFAPTVQSMTGDYRNSKYGQLPFLNEVLNAAPENIVFDALQSEEGGRFYQDQNRYLMVMADQNLPNKLPENYIWMTLNQLQHFIKYNNFLNIQTRSLMAGIQFI